MATSERDEFRLPDLGEGLEDAELIEWCVHVGQHVQENDIARVLRILADAHTADLVILVKIEGAITPNCRRGAKVGGRSSTRANELCAARRKIASCASSNTDGHHATGRCPSWLEQKLKKFDRFELARSNIRVGTGVYRQIGVKMRV